MKYLKMVFPLIIVGLLVLLFIGTPRFIRIDEIDCRSQYGECEEMLLSKLKVSEGKKLSVARYEITNVLSGEKNVSIFSIQFKLPDKISVNLLVKKPRYSILTDQKSFLIDNNGVVLSEGKLSRLPTLRIKDTKFVPGEKIPKEYLFSLRIIEKIFYLYQMKTGEIDKDYMAVTYPEGLKIIFPLSGDVDVLVGSIRVILSRLNEEDINSRIGGVGLIDLRYKNPVLK